MGGGGGRGEILVPERQGIKGGLGVRKVPETEEHLPPQRKQTPGGDGVGCG